MKPALRALLLVPLTLHAAAANEDRRVDLERALDRSTTLRINEQPLRVACRTITSQTGVPLMISERTMALLPYGAETQVSLQLDEARLREGIDSLCTQLAMRWRTTSDGVEIQPTPPLALVSRSASWEELATITELLVSPWSTSADVQTLRDQLRFREMEDDPRARWQQLAERMSDLLPGTAYEVLSRACESLGMQWYPWAGRIIVLPDEAALRHRLQRQVSLVYQKGPLMNVLQDLSRQIDIPIRVAPEAARQLPESYRERFGITAEGVTGEEALGQIVFATGLGYTLDVADQSIRLTGEARPTRRSDPIVGKVVIPGPLGELQYEWFLRESDLSDDELKRFRRLKQNAVERMKDDLRGRRNDGDDDDDDDG